MSLCLSSLRTWSSMCVSPQWLVNHSGLTHKPGWPQSTNSTSFWDLFRNIILAEAGGRGWRGANINSALCMYNFHLQRKGYSKTSSCFSDFQGAATWRESQNKSQSHSLQLQAFEMPWPDQVFKDWCFQVSIPRTIKKKKKKTLKTVIEYLMSWLYPMQVTAKQDWLG